MVMKQYYTLDVDASVALLPDLRKNVPARLKYNSKYQAWTRRVQRYRVAMLTVKI